MDRLAPRERRFELHETHARGALVTETRHERTASRRELLNAFSGWGREKTAQRSTRVEARDRLIAAKHDDVGTHDHDIVDLGLDLHATEEVAGSIETQDLDASRFIEDRCDEEPAATAECNARRWCSANDNRLVLAVQHRPEAHGAVAVEGERGV